MIKIQKGKMTRQDMINLAHDAIVNAGDEWDASTVEYFASVLEEIAKA